jgi:uncharacterized repeat protein (TIGR02543 family)/LPXTG-motif cell wall-anchored protein
MFNASFSPPAENLVVHAQWTQIPFAVTFEEHGGTAVPDETFVSGGTLALPANPTRAGYTFNGWFTAQTGGTKYGSIASPPDGNLVVHAQWTQNPAPTPTPAATPFAVTYEEHGGTTVPDATFVSGGSVTLPPAPTRAGYTFNGWFTSQTGGTKLNASFSPSDGNVAVHAQWSPVLHNVTYEEHGGTTVPDATFVSGGTVTLPPAPTRAGYTFNGWFTSQTGGTKLGASFSPSDGNVAVHAQWTQNPAPAATPVMISATPRALPTTGNDVGSLLLLALSLMALGLYVRARRTELCA